LRAGLRHALAEARGRDDTVGGKSAGSGEAIVEATLGVLRRGGWLTDRAVERNAIQASREALKILRIGTHLKTSFLHFEEAKLLFGLALGVLDVFVHLLVLGLFRNRVSIHLSSVLSSRSRGLVGRAGEGAVERHLYRQTPACGKVLKDPKPVFTLGPVQSPQYAIIPPETQ
jgi:hypothetical protein